MAKVKKGFNLYPATTIQSRGKISDCSTTSFPLKQFKAMEKDNPANKDKMTQLADLWLVQPIPHEHVIPSIPNYKKFWVFQIHNFCYALRYTVQIKAMYLEKPKCLIIWNGGSSLLKVGDLVWRIVNIYRIQNSMTKAINILWGRWNNASCFLGKKILTDI